MIIKVNKVRDKKERNLYNKIDILVKEIKHINMEIKNK